MHVDITILTQCCQANVKFLSHDMVAEVGLGAQIKPPHADPFFGDPI